MKTRIIFAAAMILLMVSFAQAAHLASQTGGGLWGQVNRYINDDDMEISSGPNVDSGETLCETNISGETEYSYAYGAMSGEATAASHWGPGFGTAVNLNANANCHSEDSLAGVWAYGTVGTLVPAYTDGIFFVIEPDAGESVGDSIRIQWYWSAECDAFSGDAQASVSEGGTIYLTRNATPPTGMPPTGIMWSREGVTFTEEDSMSDTGSFVAQIGDVIGVFFNANARVNLEGAGSSETNVNTSMELLAGETLPKLVEYTYAPGLVYDPEQNITFLKDWSAAGGPINWDEASTWVQNFTYNSNGVTYSNWRMPTTIDAQGAAAGEFGYLSTNYGISEAYFGPFMNISAGDYWTSPQFARGEDPNIAYAFTFSTTYGPAQWWSLLDSDCYVIPVFDGPPTEKWCPADFNNDGIVDFEDFATFASYWLNQRPEVL
jgi:hypothetical protein